MRGLRSTWPHLGPVKLQQVRMEQVGVVSPRRRGLLLAGIVLAVGTVAAVAWWARAPGPAATPSIAILPFENLSAARDDAWLAAGIQDELINLLSRAGAMRVTSRNSTDRFAGVSLPAAQIGRALGVNYLLSGAVARGGDSVRIRLALRDAAADRLLWESNVERGVQDLFAVESEAAQAVTEALQARRLTAAERN